MWQEYLDKIKSKDVKALARCISLIENETAGYENLMQMLPSSPVPVIGITGPPGAGKSTLVDSLIGIIAQQGKRVAILCVDPSSPFNLGALLGDRVRMSEWYDHPNVFIRSLATRGALGGLHPKIIEITDLLKAAAFDYIIVETVGVGQSEVEIAGLADATVVVVVPEAGDEIQTMKAGLMEIADMFVVNKCDRPEADTFVKNLRLMLAPAFHLKEDPVPVLKTTASQKQGVKELYDEIIINLANRKHSKNHYWLLTEKAFQLIEQKRMADINKAELKMKIEGEGDNFNLYRFVQQYVTVGK